MKIKDISGEYNYIYASKQLLMQLLLLTYLGALPTSMYYW